jgi:hypothetical protein
VASALEQSMCAQLLPVVQREATAEAGTEWEWHSVVACQRRG